MTSLSKFLNLAPKPRPLDDGQKYSVFLSYRSVNRKWVISLYDALTLAGHTVFLDQKELVAEGKLRRALEDALKNSAAGILIWSNASADSEWVRDEYDAMQDRVKDKNGFCFVPVKLDNSELPRFAQAQLFIDFSNYPGGPNGGELLQVLHGVVGKPLSDEAMRFAELLSESSKEAEAAVASAIDIGNVSYLRKLFDKGGLAWEVSPHLKSLVVEGFARLDAHDQAIELAKSVVDEFKDALRPKQMLAHLLTRTNAPDDLTDAQLILAKLYNKGERDPETLGLYAKTFFQVYLASGTDSTSRNIALLRRSRDLYKEGFSASRDDTYCGINAATKSLLLGGKDVELAQSIAAEVASRLPSEISAGMDYWDAATIAEATLIAGQVEDATQLYAHAIACAPMETGNHKSTLAQIKNIAQSLELSSAETATLIEPFGNLTT